MNMKKLILLAGFLIISTMVYCQKYPSLKIGEKFPISELDYVMKSTNSTNHRVSQHLENNGLLIIFTSNNCPFVVAWEDRYKLIEKLCANYNIDLLFVNSNHSKRNGDDSFSNMQYHARNQAYQAPYLFDDKSRLANSLGAKTTPHIFLFDNKSILVYKGAIDDNYESINNVNKFYIKDAIESLSKGVDIKTSETKALGCSIKR